MIIGGGWVVPIIGVLLGALQIFGAAKELKSLSALQSASAPEEVEAAIQQAKQEAIQNVMQEAA